MKKTVQSGFIDPKLIVGGVVVLIIVFFLATGSFKFSASIDKNSPDQAPESSSQGQQEQSTAKTESKPKTYQNEENGFSLEYPSEWSLKENPASGYIAGILSPKQSDSDTYQESLLIKAISTTPQPNITLQEVADSWENQTTKAEGSVAVSDRKDTNLGGQKARSIIYTFTSEGGSGKGMATITLKNNKAYIFQYNATEKDFNEFLPVVETIQASVKFN